MLSLLGFLRFLKGFALATEKTFSGVTSAPVTKETAYTQPHVSSVLLLLVQESSSLLPVCLLAAC